MTITQFDRPQALAFLKELEAVAKELADKHGVIYMPGRSTYDFNKLTAKLDFNVRANSATTTATMPGVASMPSVTAALVSAAKRYGMDVSIVGPEGARLVDYKPQNHKYPWIVEKRGKRWKWPTDMAQRAFKPIGAQLGVPAQPPVLAPNEPPTLDSTVGSTMPKRNGTTGNYESEF